MNKCTSLNNVMGTWCPLALPVTTLIFPLYNLFFLNKCVAPAPQLQCAGSKYTTTHINIVYYYTATLVPWSKLQPQISGEAREMVVSSFGCERFRGTVTSERACIMLAFGEHFVVYGK